MFRNEVYQLLRDTEPEWMQNFRGAHEVESELPAPILADWGNPVSDEYAPPAYSQEQAITDTDFDNQQAFGYSEEIEGALTDNDITS